MTREPIIARPTDTIHTALAIMTKERVRRLPVLDVFWRVQGLLSIEDVVVRGLETGGVGPERFLDVLADADTRSFTTFGHGFDVRITGEPVSAAALVFGSRVIHLAASTRCHAAGTRQR
jgi:CBS domain-containing protein